MRFLANENVPGAAVSVLKPAGDDVVREADWAGNFSVIEAVGVRMRPIV